MAEISKTLTTDETFEVNNEDTLVLENVKVLQNIGGQTIIYSKDPFTETNRGFRLGNNDILILSAETKLYVGTLYSYSKGYVMASKGGY